MSGLDAAELALFADSVRSAVAAHSGARLDAVLAELGWVEALDAAPQAAVSALFDAQGRTGAVSSSLCRVLAHALGREDTTLVLPWLGGCEPPGTHRDGRLDVRGTLLGPAPSDGRVAVPLGDAVAVVAVSELTLESRHGIDPGAGLLVVTGSDITTDAEPTRGPWSDAVRLGHLALAHELIGTARTMLELACTHARDRVQFGQPIAAFQAVRHRLADAFLAIEAAESLATAAWQDGTQVTAAMAKAVAGRAARTATRHCQQVLAGIGFTTEHRFHLYLRRTLLLDQLLGSSRALTRELGEQMIAKRRLPDLLPL